MSNNYILIGKSPKQVFNLIEWAEKFQNSKRTVQRDLIRGVEVSTVFLGIDHNFSSMFNPESDARPILFETMVFGGKHDGYQKRYCTWDEAEEGHQLALKMVNANAWQKFANWIKRILSKI